VKLQVGSGAARHALLQREHQLGVALEAFGLVGCDLLFPFGRGRHRRCVTHPSSVATMEGRDRRC